MFSGIKLYFYPDGIIKARRKILENQFTNNGGILIENLSDDENNLGLNYVLVDDDFDVKRIRSTSILRDKHKIGDAKILRTKWLSNCVKQKSLITDLKPYEVDLVDENEVKKDAPDSKNDQRIEENEQISSHAKSKNVKHETFGRRSVDDVYNMTTESSNSSSEDEQPRDGTPPPSKKGNFVCEKPSPTSDNSELNHNKKIRDKLQVLADGYKSTKDKWRALSYEKAINVLKYYPKEVTTREEVKKLRGIGDRLAEKILEIVESGELRKADAFSSNEKLRVMNLFNDIWGVGPTIAEQWYIQGFRSLDDIRTKAKLTHQQEIGLKYYDEILQRIPRKEAKEIVEIVCAAVNDIDPGFICQACGSYRRGRPTCGDVDFLITHPDNHSHDSVLSVLVQNLTDSGFLTDHLVECSVDGNHKKYMGICKVPGENKKHRRIDIIAIPYDEYPTALIYFTGSAHFVRSIYAKAKSMGWRLNAHGLRGGVMRQGGEMLNDGYLIETPTEESVFEKLGIAYRTPEERDHL